MVLQDFVLVRFRPRDGTESFCGLARGPLHWIWFVLTLGLVRPNHEFPVEYLLQRNVGIGFPEHILLQLELTVLDGRDGDAVDVADSAVADAEPGEQA
jgi:hypothetical protein